MIMAATPQELTARRNDTQALYALLDIRSRASHLLLTRGVTAQSTLTFTHRDNKHFASVCPLPQHPR